MVVGAVGDGMSWTWFHNLKSELGALFVGVVE